MALKGGACQVVTTDKQVRRLMVEMGKHGVVGVAAARSGMDRKTARKYVARGKLPSELKQPRTWLTRSDPFAEDWPEVVERLVDAPELESKALFEYLLACRPERYEPGQVRTFQRHVRRWRAQWGPPKEVFFAQEHRPGEALQTDFTWATTLGVTIGGLAFVHMLCHVVLPYSNWQWATVCLSESMAALRRGVQAAVFRLGHLAEYHQTDHSTAATHDLASGKRGFNEEYAALMRHLDMKPRTIGVGECEQNGDIEAANGVLKRRLKQHLVLRGSKDFDSVADYEDWLAGALDKANGLRGERLREELAVMRRVAVERLPEYKEDTFGVSAWSTIRVKHNAYSVPSRLIGETVKVRVYDDRLEVFHADVRQFVVERLHGRNGHRVNYRHIIWSLVQKPGAFARYKYREDLFPSLTFRKAYDALTADRAGRPADIEYLRILHLSASTLEADVEAALELLHEAGEVPLADTVKALVSSERPTVPDMVVPCVDLSDYDALLEAWAEVA